MSTKPLSKIVIDDQLSFGLRMVPDVRCESQPHQGALCCIVSVGLLLFLNRKTEKPIVNT
jgi:hypothetical protein